MHYWLASVPLEGQIVLFTEDFLLLAPSDFMVLHELSFFHSLEDTPEFVLQSEERTAMELLFRSIAGEYQENKFRSDSVLRAYLHILLVQMQRICTTRRGEAETNRAVPSLVRHFKQLITRQFMVERSVQVYAKQLGVTVAHLNNIVKSITGQTPGRLIRQEVVIEAKRLFAHTEMTAAEVGYRLGFHDPSYFSRFFQREVGMNTMQFRQSMQETYRN